ncbi:glutathione S-transferase [Kockovaella imperatae]|uniref:Glutathione S-transferase omega-like 2 n=1 Tax=Kockovaella imperatae TaxID=4999 RepID=A0A1Y1U6C8_9TREE|nr:glutathione S-transferase [Kockovaella imperatae]ORX33591.1 glutathione S-transferase [Kockovaella imperatae]
MATNPGWAGKDGHFKRQVSAFRDHIEENGEHPPEKGRYHLYVCYACPWAHRALIIRQLKGLEDYIDVSYVHPHMLEGGWHFVKPDNAKKQAAPVSEHSFDTFPGSTEDHLFGSEYMSEIYKKADPNYSQRFTVPVVWDKKSNTLVNNESSEIIRDFNSAFNSTLPDGEKKELDLYPEDLRKEIDELNTWVYDDINNGVYKSGFATTQEAYEKNVVQLFKSLDRVEKILSDGRDYLIGGKLTEADVRTYTTIVRFDPVYHGHFKCNLGSIRHDYPHINRWLKNLYWNNPAFKDTTDFDQIKEHYYYSHGNINPTRVVPLGPKEDIEPL